MPYLRSDPPSFMFLIHPRDVGDLHTAPGASVIYQHSATEDEFRDKMLTLPPTITGEVSFGFGPIRGETLVVFRMPEQIMFSGGRAEIEHAVRVACARGTRVIGLGALTAPATRGGLSLLPLLPGGVTLTTGNAYTAAVARSNVVAVSEATGLGRDATVAVVGCTGSVGVCASRLLDARGYRLTLIGRSVSRVRKELADLTERATVSATIADVARADIVLLLTGDPAARIPPALPRPGSVVLDLAHPVNIEPARYPDFAARGVQVLQGGLVRIPGYHCAQEMRLPDRGSALACLTETYLFAKAGITTHSVGPASVTTALMLEDVAADHGVAPWPLELHQLSVLG
ncbi:MAG: fatty aldehyde-rating acyl-ACP reductase [Micromonosporaceae bacterium]|jgi:predicted amino acid dehydrogenase|nr:fatty aldehyde-rating acyl-ACP reductase [Micromonosporaceae bacterium]